MTTPAMNWSWRGGPLALAALAVLLAPTGAWAAGPLSFYSVTPCRIIDTRGPVGPTGGPKLNANTQRDFPILSLCGVPPTAQAVAFNITVTQPTDLGDLRIWPAGAAMPPASVINWVTTDVAVANGAIIPLGSSGGNNISVRCDMPPGSVGQVHMIVDVSGYFQ